MTVTRTPLRLTPADTQQAFCTLLRALATPGCILTPGAPPADPATVLLPLVLADFTCTVAVVGDRGRQVEDWLTAATGAVAGPSQAADQVVVLDLGSASPELVEGLRRGTALAPEEGARLALAVSEIGSGPVLLRLNGPGIPGELDLRVSGPRAAVFEALARVNSRFPTGVDTWLFAPDGSMAAIPRSTQVKVLEG